MAGLPQHIAADIEYHLDAIARWFKNPTVTLVVRNDIGEGLDADVVMTKDEIPRAIEVLQRRHADEAPGTGEGRSPKTPNSTPPLRSAGASKPAPEISPGAIPQAPETEL